MMPPSPSAGSTPAGWLRLPRRAASVGVWVALAGFTLAVLRHYEGAGDRGARNRSRVMYLVESLGLERYRQEVLQSWQELEGEAAVALPHDGSHLVSRAPRDLCGVHPQKQPGLCWLGLNVPMGRLDAAAMAELARLARTYGSGELRLSESQNVLLVNVPEEIGRAHV